MKNKGLIKEVDKRKTIGTITVVVCSFLLFCLISKNTILGGIGNGVANFLLGIFGLTSYAYACAGIVLGIMILLNSKITLPKLQIFNFCVMFLSLTLLIQLISSAGVAAGNEYPTYLGACYDYGKMPTFGGAFAGLFTWPLCNTITVVGAYIFVIALLILTIFVCAEYFFKLSQIKIEKKEKQSVQKQVAVKKESAENKLFVSTISEEEFLPEPKTSKSFNELYGDSLQSGQEFGQFSFPKNQESQSQKSAHEQLFGDFWQTNNYSDFSKNQEGNIPNTSYIQDFEKYSASPISEQNIKSAPISSFGSGFDAPPAIFHSEENIESEEIDVKKADEFLAGKKSEKRVKNEEAKKDLYILKGMMTPDETLPPIVNGDEVSDQLKRKNAYNSQSYTVFQNEEKAEDIEVVEVAEENKNENSFYSNEDVLFEEDIKRYDANSTFEDISVQSTNIDFAVDDEEVVREIDVQEIEEDSQTDFYTETESCDEEIIIKESTEEVQDDIKYVEKPFVNKNQDRAFQVGLASVVDGGQRKEKPVHKYKKYVPPIYTLLDNTAFDPSLLTENFNEIGYKIQETLAVFKVEATLRNIVTGPTVTRYEFEIAKGTSVTKVNGLVDDITLAIAAPGPVRIQTPIPGKSLFGIEVPNKKVAVVSLRSVLESSEFLGAPQKGLTYALGIDIGGKKIVSDIADMPHMLIAGATGQGKSVCVNSIIISMLYKYGPEELRFIMVDPKQVEFTPYAKLPHLMINNIICEPEKAISAFDWLIKEMERRFKQFAEYSVRDINGYNSIIDTNTTEKLPRIILIVDEVADLMQYNKNEIESRIQRLTQKARAAGIHLILATQRPSVDVITGVIKANIPSRLALRVSSSVDSRTILDQIGAEKLVAKGDMLFKSANMSEPIRLQGSFVSDQEVCKVVDFIAANNESYFDNDIADEILKVKKELSGGNTDEEVDELFFDALKYVIEQGVASISLLQRRFKMGYNRAGRVLQEMEDRHFVSPYDGAKPRQVLIDMVEYQQMFGDK